MHKLLEKYIPYLSPRLIFISKFQIEKNKTKENSPITCQSSVVYNFNCRSFNVEITFMIEFRKILVKKHPRTNQIISIPDPSLIKDHCKSSQCSLSIFMNNFEIVAKDDNELDI